MKKILTIAFLLTYSLVSKATNFTLSIAAVDSAFVTFKASSVVVDTDLARINRLGARPTNPTYDTTAAQWNAYVASVSAYDSTLSSLQSLLATHTATKRTDELAVLATIGYGSSLSNTPVNQCIKVQWGGGTYSAWIGYPPVNNPSLVVIYTAPTRPFPLY